MALADDMYSGYGKRMLYDEGEISLFNNKDTIVAGTDLFKPVIANDMVSMGSIPSSSPPPPSKENVVSQELIAQNRQMLNLFKENFRRQSQQTTEQTQAIRENRPAVDIFGGGYGEA